MWVASVSVNHRSARDDRLRDRIRETMVSSVFVEGANEEAPSPSSAPRTPSGAAHAADILAMARAALDSVTRAIRTAPEVRSNRLISRVPVDIEDVLMELEPIQAETPISELAGRLGVSAAQLRSTSLRLQRLGLVKVAPGGVSLTGSGRQRLARLEMARASVLRRLAGNLHKIPSEHAELVLSILSDLLDRSDEVVDQHLGGPAAR